MLFPTNGGELVCEQAAGNGDARASGGDKRPGHRAEDVCTILNDGDDVKKIDVKMDKKVL